MKTEYTHKQKLAYYKSRASDSALTASQRSFAQGFVNGADDTYHAYTFNTTAAELSKFLKDEIPRREKENKTFVNPTYNGYGQGTVSALKDLAARTKKGKL